MRPNRDLVSLFFAYPAEIRKVIYTTNAVESQNELAQSDQDARFVSE